MRYRDYSTRMDYIRQRKEQLCGVYDDNFSGYSHEKKKIDVGATGKDRKIESI